ncbi:hypothetical protein QFC22_001714 [Naganishia vaughanmartiniae]|uniref:Uncharacterized protein n=1 Tax=Naganishia vaughanmartiniae TaxID=1424756 RepID=A0ACC2XEP2_9TREE|nr:hypothetical protein QFC22_001714 [Naganishia vaughanmartiniae]
MVEDKVSGGQTLEQYEQERIDLKQKLAIVNAKYENLEEEFGKMEEQVMDKTTKLERIHGTVSELERRNKALIKRQALQEENFELERRERADTERTLQSRVDDLKEQVKRHLSAQVEAESALQNEPLNNNPSTTHDQQITEAHLLAQTKTVAHLRSRMADMSESQLSLTEKYTSLSLHIHTLEHEVAERTAECYRLREENEGYEILLRERTLDGRVYDADVFGEMTDDEDEEAGMSDSTKEMDADSQARSEAHVALRTKPHEEPRSSRRQKALNLAEELDNSIGSINMHADGDEDDVDRSEKGQTPHAKDASDSVLESLKAEVKALSDANKALRLYCSKILDRILLHENEDHFLVDVSGSLNRKAHPRTVLQKVAADGDTRNRQTSARDRPAVTPQTYQTSNGDAHGDLREAGNSTSDQTQKPQLHLQPHRSVSQTPVVLQNDSKRGLPSIQVETVATVVAPTAVKGRLRPLSIVAKKEEREKEAKKAESASEKRVRGIDEWSESFVLLTFLFLSQLRRGFSLDWRSFSGARSASPERAPSPDDRAVSPHTSSADATVPYPSSRPAITNSRSYDKKLEIIEDDEEDRVERERLSTTLKLMGVTSPSGASSSSLTVAEDVANSRQSNNISPKPSPNAFSRLSAFFGRSANDASPSSTQEDTEESNNLAWNHKSEGRNYPGQMADWNISPSQSRGSLSDTKGGYADILAESRMASREKRALSESQVANMSAMTGTGTGLHRRTAGGDESLSTLWSLGSEVSDT